MRESLNGLEGYKTREILKNRNGITLIALIITVIIMLILAGVAISVITGDGGLFEKTRNAADAYGQAAQSEAEQIKSLMNDIDSYLNKIPGDPVTPTEPDTTDIATVVSVGDYVNYDAGTWTEADLTKITSSAGSPTVNKSISLPSTQGQFGGFTVGQSRNTNSTEDDSSYKPRTAGWRVWSIEGNVVTLISAGHPETYYHAYGESTASVNILRNRNCSMYENSYAQAGSAHFLTGEEATRWYNKQYGTSYDESKCLYDLSSFSTAEPISVLENGSYYWFASAYSSNGFYGVGPSRRCVFIDGDYGMRCAPPSFSKIWSPSRTRQWRRKRG